MTLNSLLSPIDKPAVKQAPLGAINQRDIMQAVFGDDPPMWRDKVSVFAPGTPLATGAGIEVPSSPRDCVQVKRDLTVAGYNGKKITSIAATYFPAINALCEISADMFQGAAVNLDY